MPATRSSRMRLVLSILVLATAMPWLVGPSGAEAPNPPPYYAIQNVRVVTGAGDPIEGATVLLADGLIEAVGKKVKIPGDAWVIDAEGLTLYPGMVDALTAMAQKKEKEESGGNRSRRDAPVVTGPESRPMTTPWLSPVEKLDADKKIGKWRQAGFTSVVTAPEKGIFAGQAAMVNLVDAPDRGAVVATPVAQRLNFRGASGFRTYPGSLMGVLSYIDQVFIDTSHYTKVKSAYAKDPAGRVRPEYDRTLEPIELAIADGTPFLMPANLAREIDRVLVMQRNTGVEAIVYGGQGAYARAAELREAKTPVLVNLNWPKAEKGADPDADTPFRTLAHRRLAPTTPAVLAEAGVPFGFYSGGLGSPSEIFEKVRMATDNGLGNEAALAALTSGPASIYGVSDRLGTIEKGKIANLVLASDWPWADGVEVKMVFVDGRRYEERRSDEPAEKPESDVSGTWSLALQSPGGTRDITADIEMSEDGKVKGKITSDMGETAVDEARMSGNELRFKTTRELGGRSVTGSWTLTIDGETAAGTMSAGPMQMDVSGTRTAKSEPGGEEEEEGDEGVALDEIREALAVYQGPAKQMGTFAITNAQVWTVSGETIENGTVVVKNGKIAAVGSDVRIPGGAEVIDAKGGAVTPGIIDAHSHIAIEGGVNEGSLVVTSMVAIGDVLNPDDVAIYRAVAGGVTAANLLHGSSNPIGGRNQVIKLRWGSDAEGLKFDGAPKGIKFALGENPKRSNFTSSTIPQRYPQTRMGVMDVIRDAFTEALAYQAQWDAYEAGARNGIKPELPRRDRELEALVEILEGERLVHSHCYRADEILQLMRVAEEFGFTVGTLQHVLEGYKVADEIAAHGAGASTFSDWWGYKVEAYEAIPHNAALMAERDVVVSINSDSGEEIRHLNHEAGKAVKWGGMDEIEALKLVTLNPAIQLGIDHRVGSIEVGKDADLVVFDGHPLEIRSVVQMTFIDGNLYFSRERDAGRQALVAGIKERLQGKDGEAKDGGGSEKPGAFGLSARSPEVRWADDIYTCREDH